MPAGTRGAERPAPPPRQAGARRAAPSLRACSSSSPLPMTSLFEPTPYVPSPVSKGLSHRGSILAPLIRGELPPLLGVWLT